MNGCHLVIIHRPTLDHDLAYLHRPVHKRRGDHDRGGFGIQTGDLRPIDVCQLFQGRITCFIRCLDIDNVLTLKQVNDPVEFGLR